MSLLDLNGTSELSNCVDAWVTALCGAVTRDITLIPQISKRIEKTGEVELSEGTVTAARHGVRWAVVDGDEGAAQYLSTEFLGGEQPCYAPLTPEAWIQAGSTSTLRVATTEELRIGGTLHRALADFHSLIANAELLNRHLLEADLANAQLATRHHRLTSERIARQGFISTLKRGTRWLSRRSVGDHAQGWHSALASALNEISDFEGIALQNAQESLDKHLELDEILRATGVRYRRVALTTDEQWWRNDSGALLGFLREDDKPVALLPSGIGGYQMSLLRVCVVSMLQTQVCCTRMRGHFYVRCRTLAQLAAPTWLGLRVSVLAQTCFDWSHWAWWLDWSC